MVERLLCKQDVSGSSPLTSTSQKDSALFQGQTFLADDVREVGKMEYCWVSPVKNLDNCIEKEKVGRTRC